MTVKRLCFTLGAGIVTLVVAAAEAQPAANRGDSPFGPGPFAAGSEAGRGTTRARMTSNGQPPSPTPGSQGPDMVSLDTVKSQLKATDEEWKVISPLLRKVVAARRVAYSGLNSGMQFANFGGPRGGFGGQRRFGGPGGPGGKSSFDSPADVGAGGFGSPGAPGAFGPRGGGPPGFGPPGNFGPGGAAFGPPPEGGNPPDASNNTRTTGRQNNRFNANDNRPSGAAQQPPFGGPPGFGPRGGFGPPGFGPREGAVGAAMAELVAAAADKNTSPEVLKQKVEAVRAARKKAIAQLDALQKELVDLLSPEQEAVLVGQGFIE